MPAPLTWHERGELGVEAQGPFAPEMLAWPGPDAVYSRRFAAQHADGTWSVVTLSAAPIWASEAAADAANYGPDADTDADERADDLAFPFAVDECTETIRCTDPDDPGSTELDADYAWGPGSYLAYRTYAEAADEARRLVTLVSADMFGGLDDTDSPNRLED